MIGKDSNVLIDEFLCLIKKLEIKEQINLLQTTNETIKDKLRIEDEIIENKKKRKASKKSIKDPIEAEKNVCNWLLTQDPEKNDKSDKKSNAEIKPKTIKRENAGLNLDQLLSSYKEDLNNQEGMRPLLVFSDDEEEGEEIHQPSISKQEENLKVEDMEIDNSPKLQKKSERKGAQEIEHTDISTGEKGQNEDEGVDAAKGLILPLMMVRDNFLNASPFKFKSYFDKSLAGQGQNWNKVQDAIKDAAETKVKKRRATVQHTPHFWDEINEDNADKKPRTYSIRPGLQKGPEIKHKDQAMRMLGIGSIMTETGARPVRDRMED